MTSDTETVRVVPVRHYGRWATALLVVGLTALFLRALFDSPNLEPGTIANYLFKDYVLDGVVTTLWLTLLAMVLGTVGGVLLAVMRLSENPVLRGVSWAFIWVFRGTPLLVQIILFGFLGALFPRISLTVPFTGTILFDKPTSVVVTGTVAAVLALSLNEMAYAAEVIRGGILAVDDGQTEAAAALGMSPTLTLRRVVLPQAMRVIIPPMGNETINMLKMTALVSVISAHDLMSKDRKSVV